MSDLKIDLALEIMQLKIIDYIKNYSGNDKQEFENQLKILISEREKIYSLDEETIEKVYNVYLEEIKKEK